MVINTLYLNMIILKTTLLSLCFCCFYYCAMAQISDSGVLKNCNKKYKQYIPKAYEIIDTIMGDYNNDAMQDVLLVLQKLKTIDSVGSDNRAILLLQKTKDSYVKNILSLNALLCYTCGGIFGNPYSGIRFTNNVLKINHYGGSADRWGYEHTFRYQNNAWELIGISNIAYRTYGNCEEVTSNEYNKQEVNFSTKKMHLVETKSGECKPSKDVWKTVTKLPKVTLAHFNITTDYFELIQ